MTVSFKSGTPLQKSYVPLGVYVPQVGNLRSKMLITLFLNMLLRFAFNFWYILLFFNSTLNKKLHFIFRYLQFLKSLTPPPMLFGEDRGRSIVYNVWTDDIVRACLYLFLSLLPQNLRLFKHMVTYLMS